MSISWLTEGAISFQSFGIVFRFFLGDVKHSSKEQSVFEVNPVGMIWEEGSR